MIARALLLLVPCIATAQVPLPEPTGAADDGVHVLEFVAGGGVVALEVDAATAGSEPAAVSDGSTELHWVNGLGATAKLTVRSTCPGQQFGLTVQAQVGTGSATAAPPVDLIDGMAATDLLLDISSDPAAREGTATITYRASATVADGTSADHGDDVHTVVYTLLDQ